MKKIVSLLLVAVLMFATFTALAAGHTDKRTVKQVQQALNDAGYSCGAPDGVAGKKTAAAIRQYRADNGLDAGDAIDDQLLADLGLDTSETDGNGADDEADADDEDDAADDGGDADSGDTAVEPDWPAYDLTPMHYEYYDETIRVRVVCKDVPVDALYREMANFPLIDDDGSVALSPCEMRVLEAPVLEKNLVRTADYFDIVYPLPEGQGFTPGDHRLKLVDQVADLPPLGRNDLSACCFVTDDGAYVISLYSEDAYRAVIEKYAGEWKGKKDVQLIIGGGISGGGYAYFSVHKLLNSCDASSIRLVFSDRIGLFDELENPGRIQEMAVSNHYCNGSYPGVRKLTCCLGEKDWDLPDFGEHFPNLTELNVVCCGKYDSQTGNYLRESKKTQENTCGKLKTLNIISREESPFTFDTDVRIWLIAQAKRTPSAKINGKKAGTIDFVSDMPEEARKSLELPEEYEAIRAIYRDSIAKKDLKKREITLEDLELPLYVAVLEYTQGEIVTTSTDIKRGDSLRDIPEEALAGSLRDARTIVIIYPTYRVVGAYYFNTTGVKHSDASECTTNMTVLKYDSGKAKVVANQILRVAPPPRDPFSQTVTYEPRKGAKRIAELLGQP